MPTLVTGAEGCIGAWVVRNLLDLGDSPIVFDLSSDARRLRLIADESDVRRVTFVTGNVTDAGAVRRAIEEHRADRVIHLAGLQVPACKSDPVRGALVNVIGTLAVFEAAKAAKIARVVYASSAAVFGPPEDYPEGSATDSAATGPRTHYGVFKVANELSARVYFESDGVSSVGLRPWAVYGPGRDFGMTSAPTLAIQAAVLGVPYRIPYGGMNDLQFVDDVAKAFVASASASSPVAGARVYNLRGEVVAIDRVIAEIEAAVPSARGRLTRGEGQLGIAFDLDDGGFRRDVGGGVPKTPLAEGIRKTVAIFERLSREGRLPALPA